MLLFEEVGHWAYLEDTSALGCPLPASPHRGRRSLPHASSQLLPETSETVTKQASPSELFSSGILSVMRS